MLGILILVLYPVQYWVILQQYFKFNSPDIVGDGTEDQTGRCGICSMKQLFQAQREDFCGMNICVLHLSNLFVEDLTPSVKVF